MITNKENTIKFKKDGDYYRVFMLPDHPFYEFRPDGTRGGLILSPDYIDYDCWIGENLVVDGKIREGSVVIANCVVNDVTPSSLNFIDPAAVIKKSDIRGSFVRVVGSNLEGVRTINYDAHHEGNIIEISDSKITGSLDIFASLHRLNKLHIVKSELHGKMIANIKHLNDTLIIDSVLVGNVKIGMDVEFIDRCFVMSDNYTFTEVENRCKII